MDKPKFLSKEWWSKFWHYMNDPVPVPSGTDETDPLDPENPNDLNGLSNPLSQASPLNPLNRP